MLPTEHHYHLLLRPLLSPQLLLLHLTLPAPLLLSPQHCC
jgi:hypothetical protein